MLDYNLSVGFSFVTRIWKEKRGRQNMQMGVSYLRIKGPSQSQGEKCVIIERTKVPWACSKNGNRMGSNLHLTEAI